MYDLGIINGLVYYDKTYHKKNIYIKNGIIKKLDLETYQAKEIYDAKSMLIYPGIIDPHTHFQLDLGKYTSQDNFKDGTKAASFGGVTTIIDFLAPVDNSEDLKNEFARRKQEAFDSVIDYKFHACLKNPKGKVLDIVESIKKYGLNTIKIFTTYSDSNRRTYYPEIEELLNYTKTHNFTLTVHVENDDLISINKEFSYKDLPISRPTESETSEALKLAELVRKTQGKMYMVHLSSGETLKKLKNEYGDILNQNLIIESCPHYFLFSNEKLNEEDGYLYSMAPPLRSHYEKELLKRLIDDVYVIGTDHCTFKEEYKKENILSNTPLGVGGVEYSFDVLYAIFGDKIIDKMTLNVAKAHKLYPQKGTISIGSDADMFIYKKFDRVIDVNHSSNDHNIYRGCKAKGQVISTISRGEFVVKDLRFFNRKGKLLNQEVD